MSPADPDPISQPILTLRDVRLAFGARQALAGVSLEVRPGEIYALLGPNGAGKSTLTGVICGRLRPDSGEVRLDGRDPFADRRARAALGLAPQALALYPLLTARENLEAFARLAGLKGAEAREAVADALDVTRLAERAGSQVRHLSGGYQRRVNIAAAILGHPKLLVLDEPTVGVDQAAREAVADVLRRLKAEGVAVLLITHDLDQAAELADRVGFLCAGEKRLEGAPAALIGEAFGQRMEVAVDLAAGEGASLAAEGLEPGREAGCWTCLADDGYARASELAARLTVLGLTAREIRVRRPSLEHLMARIAAPEELAA